MEEHAHEPDAQPAEVTHVNACLTTASEQALRTWQANGESAATQELARREASEALAQAA